MGGRGVPYSMNLLLIISNVMEVILGKLGEYNRDRCMGRGWEGPGEGEEEGH